MSIQFVACFLAIATGLIFSGTVATLWATVNDEPPYLGMLQEGGFFAPVKGLVVALTAPTNLIWHGANWMIEGPVAGALFLVLGLALSLLQGVVILNLFFGVS